MCGHIVEEMLEKCKNIGAVLIRVLRPFGLEAHLTLNPLLGGDRLIVLRCWLWLGWGANTVWRVCALRAGDWSRFLFINCQRVGDLLMH